MFWRGHWGYVKMLHRASVWRRRALSASKICDHMFGALKATGVECVEFDME